MSYCAILTEKDTNADLVHLIRDSLIQKLLQRLQKIGVLAVCGHMIPGWDQFLSSMQQHLEALSCKIYQ